MAVDRTDFAHVTQGGQFGLQQQMWPIIIDPSTMTRGAEVEININPCDTIWMPTHYDASLGLNPAQDIARDQTLVAAGPYNCAYGQAVNGLPNSATVGVNVFDVFDANNFTPPMAPAIDTPGGPQYVQRAPIFALKFNSPNAPWLLWGLSTMLGMPLNAYAFSAGYGQNQPVGRGDTMRSITGPISRLFFKLIEPAYTFNQNAAGPGGQGNIAEDFPASRIVLLSMLGLNQQTQTNSWDAWNSLMVFSGAEGTPGAPTAPTGAAISSGGYVTPQLNSVERLELEAKNIFTRKQP